MVVFFIETITNYAIRELNNNLDSLISGIEGLDPDKDSKKVEATADVIQELESQRHRFVVLIDRINEMKQSFVIDEGNMKELVDRYNCVIEDMTGRRERLNKLMDKLREV